MFQQGEQGGNPHRDRWCSCSAPAAAVVETSRIHRILQNSLPTPELLLGHLLPFALLQRGWALGKMGVPLVSAALWSESLHSPLWLYLGIVTSSVPGHPWPAAIVCVTQSRSAHVLLGLSSLQEARGGHCRLVGLWFCWSELLLEVMPQMCQSLLFLLFPHPTRTCTFMHILGFVFASQRVKRQLGEHSLHLWKTFYPIFS